MIATILAFTILTAQTHQPFFFPHESETREYASEDLCLVGVRQAMKIDPDLNLLCQSGSRPIETNQVHNAEVSHEADPPVTSEEAAKNIKSQYQVRYRIGRLDEEGVLHGTAYNTTDYDSSDACGRALNITRAEVVRKAHRDGGDDSAAAQVLNQFDTLYACHEYAAETNQASAVIAQPPAQVAPTATPSLHHWLTITTVMGLPVVPSNRGLHMALMGGPQPVVYSTIYESPAQCWQAVREIIQDHQQQITQEAQQMQSTYATLAWAQNQLIQLEQYRRHLACITTTN